MGGHLVETAERLWKTWDIRVLMLVSLLLQALLTFLAPYRKRFGNAFFRTTMWVLYLLADAVALYTIGLISTSGGSRSSSSVQKRGAIAFAPAPELLAFWAPFLLLHLGGPDTITALALADNELWRRHALQFAAKLVITLYVLSWSFGTKLFLPTILMLVAGCTKYLERTGALYAGSTETFRYSQRARPEPGSDYAVLMDEYSSARGAFIPAEIKGKDGPWASEGAKIDSESTTHGGGPSSSPSSHWYRLEETDDMVRMGNSFGYKFRGILADAFVSLKDREESCVFFLWCPPAYAFRMVEIELNFIYEVFYTKAFLLNSRRGYVRLVCFLSVATSLAFFWFHDDKYDVVDVGITYALLGGAIVLDIVACVMFLFSDWCVVIPTWDSNWLLKCTVKWFYKCIVKRWRTARRGSRWSESISEYNLLKSCLKDPPVFFDKIPLVRRIKDAFIVGFYVRRRPIDEQFGHFIVKELKKKAALATDAEKMKKVCSARGNLVFHDDYLLVSEYLRPWTIDIDYDESLLTWHLATDLCYWTCPSNSDEMGKYSCRFSKQLSDYMLYLLLRQRRQVSAVAGFADVRFEDTCAEAKKFTQLRLVGWYTNARAILCRALGLQTFAQELERRRCNTLKEFCTDVLKVTTPVAPIKAKGDKSKSVLFEAARLAQRLKMFGEKQWEITAQVWIELLCFAALRCSPRSHVEQLSHGGEFLTIVWLLMANLGLGENFRQTHGYGSKLVIPK